MTAVTAHLNGKQLLLFVFVSHHRSVNPQNTDVDYSRHSLFLLAPV